MAEMRMIRFFGIGLAVILTATGAVAELRLPSVIGDGMVLQRNESPKLWGWADPGASIEVEIGVQEARTVASSDGRWQITLLPLPTGGPYTLEISGDGRKVKIEDVLVGEVWVCSGQSNMQWTVAQAQNPDWEIENGNYPWLRMFSVERTSAETPQQDCNGTWQAASSETVGEFSALGYYYARQLHTTLGVPVGMLHTSWGGTPAESWTSAPSLARTRDGDHMLERNARDLAEHGENMAAYREALKTWRKDPDGGEEPKQPNPSLWARDSWRPSGLFNAMVAPLIPYTIQGAIWYQGESNAGRAYQYRELFSAMIRDWRQVWGQGAFPFYFVQLANFNAGEEPTWPELREAQNMALKLPHTGTAVTIDIGNRDDIHPKNKQEVGRRLALVAMVDAYGRKVYHRGPVYRDISVEGGSIRVHFYHTWKGLAIHSDAGLVGFEIAGEDQQYYPAVASLDGDTVVVRSDAISKPVAVRYAWENDPPASLYNGVGLPASPFRSDDWPGITVDAK